MDGDYHKHLEEKDRSYVDLDQRGSIKYYNVLSARNAERFIISEGNNFQY